MNDITVTRNSITIEQQSRLDTLITRMDDNVRIGLKSLSDKNRADYEKTFSQWALHAESLGIDKYNFELSAVESFLTDNDWTKNTRTTRLAHIRRFALLIASADETNVSIELWGFNLMFNQTRLQLLKPKGLGGKKSVKKFGGLTSHQVYKVFDCVAGNSNRDTRNRVILALMFLNGLRIEETSLIQWSHIDYVGNVIRVIEGKGSKTVEIPMMGNIAQHLKAWQDLQALSGNFDYICTGINRGDNLTNDKPVSTTSIRKFIKGLSEKTGIEFTAHDARRTMIKDLFASGASSPDVQMLARHESGATTLRYAETTNAQTVGKRLAGKLGYGDIPVQIIAGKTETQIGIFICDNGHHSKGTNLKQCVKCKSSNLKYQTQMI